MASENKLLANKVQAPSAAVPFVIYTNSNTRDTLISATTVSNETSVDRKYKMFIVDSSGTADRALVAETTLKQGASAVVDKLIGQYIPAGGTLQGETDTATSIHFTVSGREFTT